MGNLNQIPSWKACGTAPSFGWTVLPVTTGHAQLAGLLKGNHKDPFDRMLAAQSLLENMSLITNDPAFTEFHVKTFW